MRGFFLSPPLPSHLLLPFPSPFSQKTGLSDLSHGVKNWIHHSFAFFTNHAFDRRTDRQTEFSSLDRVCIRCSAIKSSSSSVISQQRDGVRLLVCVCRSAVQSTSLSHVILHTRQLSVNGSQRQSLPLRAVLRAPFSCQ